MSPNNYSQGSLLKTQLMVTAVTAVGSLDRGERQIAETILDVFWSVQPDTVVWEPLCDPRIPFER